MSDSEAGGSSWHRSRRVGRLFRYLVLGLQLVRGAAPRLLVALVGLQVALGLATIGAVVVGGRLADKLIAIPQSGAAGISGLILAFLALTLVAIGSSSVKSEYQRLLAERTERHATDLVLGAAVAAGLQDYDSPRFHDQLIRALTSAAARPPQLVAALLGLVSAIVTSVGLGVVMIALAPRLLLVVVVGMVPLWWTARLATRKSYSFNVGQSERDRRHSYFLSSLVDRTSAAEIRVFGIGDRLRRQVAELHAARIQDLSDLIKARALLGLVGAAISVGISGLVLFGLVDLFESGSVAVDQVAVVAAAFLVLSQRLQTMNSSAASVLECALFLSDVDRFAIDTAAQSHEDRFWSGDDRGGRRIERLTLDGVSFRYPSEVEAAVEGVDLDLRTGELVAFVGQNGSGKTTLVKLLSLLYEPTDGRILINGQPSDPASAAALRRSIAVVHQNFLRLLMTAGDNIALGDLAGPGDRETIVAAARAADIDRVVAKLPHGYETMLGTEYSDGHELSGGEWQRLALARALYRNADVLILDEPASALDPMAELALVERIRELAADKVVVLVGHRFGTVVGADRIVVLDSGKVVEEGSHVELIDRGGVYASLYNTQARSYQ